MQVVAVLLDTTGRDFRSSERSFAVKVFCFYCPVHASLTAVSIGALLNLQHCQQAMSVSTNVRWLGNEANWWYNGVVRDCSKQGVKV